MNTYILSIASRIRPLMLDYNRTVMFDPESPRTLLRTRILAVILATIPCYCIGFITLSLAPDFGEGTVTATITVTDTSPTSTLSLTPLVLTGTITPTGTITQTPTPTPTFTISATPFQPSTTTSTADRKST